MLEPFTEVEDKDGKVWMVYGHQSAGFPDDLCRVYLCYDTGSGEVRVFEEGEITEVETI